MASSSSETPPPSSDLLDLCQDVVFFLQTECEGDTRPETVREAWMEYDGGTRELNLLVSPEHIQVLCHLLLQLIHGETKEATDAWKLLRKAKWLSSTTMAALKQTCESFPGLTTANIQERHPYTPPEGAAICSVCDDWEVTDENPMHTCQLCGVAVHQVCYNVEDDGFDFYCIPCLHNKTTDSLTCELCPVKGGAFFKVAGPEDEWVHCVCAKWHGLSFSPPGQTRCIESVDALKASFARVGAKCILCKGTRGAFHNCLTCNKWMHITCARATGECEAFRGEEHSNPWTLLCPEHANVECTIPNPMSRDELKKLAQELESKPSASSSEGSVAGSYSKMSRDEQRQVLADPDKERELWNELQNQSFAGAYCEACHQSPTNSDSMIRCTSCEVVCCQSCAPNASGDDFTCRACQYLEEEKTAGEEFERPRCQLCPQKGGWLVESYAAPAPGRATRFWNEHPKEYTDTLFAKTLWCHSICAKNHSKLKIEEDGRLNCSHAVMPNGKEFIFGNRECALCGDTCGMKISCAKCQEDSDDENEPVYFHATCAWQAGLVSPSDPSFSIKCFRHGVVSFLSQCSRLVELDRRQRLNANMTLEDVSCLYNEALRTMQILGWAWRWAEWWVEYGEHEASKSTQESRCEAARKCRLAAFGAALRNREYDAELDNVALERALRAVLHAQLRPLFGNEKIDMLTEWLSRAYRSKSRLLGFGEDSIPIKASGRNLHIEDQSPKYILGPRRLPGEHGIPAGAVFETEVRDVDDFTPSEIVTAGRLVTPDRSKRPHEQITYDDRSDAEEESNGDESNVARLDWPNENDDSSIDSDHAQKSMERQADSSDDVNAEKDTNVGSDQFQHSDEAAVHRESNDKRETGNKRRCLGGEERTNENEAKMRKDEKLFLKIMKGIKECQAQLDRLRNDNVLPDAEVENELHFWRQRELEWRRRLPF